MRNLIIDRLTNGYTWEYDLHLYWKRAKHLEPLYGDTAYHRERVLQEVLAGRVIE